MKVCLEVDLKNPQHIAAVVAIIRLFEVHDLCFDAPIEDTYRDIYADLETMTGSDYWNQHLASAISEIAEALRFLVIEAMEIDAKTIPDLLDPTYLEEGWKATTDSWRIVITKLDKFIAQSELIWKARIAAKRTAGVPQPS